MLKDDARILIVRFSSLGDVVMATAAARWIKAERPRSKVCFATKAAFKPLLEGQPDIDEVWALEAEGGLLGLARKARAAGLDALLDLHANWRSAALGALAGAPVTRWKAHKLNRRLRVSAPFLSLSKPEPVLQRYVRAASEALGAEPGQGVLPRLTVASAAKERALALLKDQGWREGQKLLAVAPGAAWATKRWPAEHLAQCLALVSEFDRVRFLLLGSPAERVLGDEVLRHMRKGREQVLRADGQTGDLRDLAALLSCCDHFLGHDSGPMHVAEALGVPMTVLFGPTVEAFGFYPAGKATVFERELACRPCSVHGSQRCPLGHHECLEKIEPFDVAGHLRRQLGLEAA